MSGNPKCARCGKTVYFAEKTSHDGKEYHQLCLVMQHKDDGSIHNKGWYGTTPQDKNAVNSVSSQQQQPRSGFCPQCSLELKPNAKFCSTCGCKV